MIFIVAAGILLIMLFCCCMMLPAAMLTLFCNFGHFYNHVVLCLDFLAVVLLIVGFFYLFKKVEHKQVLSDICQRHLGSVLLL